MTEQLQIGRDARVATYQQKWCQCWPCWCARCTACRQPLTKHAFTEQDAHDEAVAALDQPGRSRHDCAMR